MFFSFSVGKNAFNYTLDYFMFLIKRLNIKLINIYVLN